QGARRLPTQAHLRPPADPARSAAGLPRRRPGEGEGVAASARHHRSVRTGPDHRKENQSHRVPGPTPGPLGPSNNSNGLTMTPWVTSTNGLTGLARSHPRSSTLEARELLGRTERRGFDRPTTRRLLSPARLAPEPP